MKINFFTFNMGGTHDGATDVNGLLKTWSEIFTDEKNEWRDFFSKTGIWVVCTQEDKQESDFMNALHKNILKEDNYKYFDKTPTHVYLNKFSVHLAVFVPINLNGIITKGENSLYHNSYNSSIKNMVCHKSSVIIDYLNIRFVGCHLPFNPHDETNINKRKTALEKILKLQNDKIMFIMGDLNFRKTNGIDQLTQYIQDNPNIIDITSGLPNTCKTVNNLTNNCEKVYKGKSIKSIQLSSIQRSLYTPIQQPYSQEMSLKNSCESPEQNINVQNFVTNSQKCYVTSIIKKSGEIKLRTPSLCDRILMVYSRQVPVTIKYEAETILFYPINLSDHNAVYAQVTIPDEITEPAPAGGNKPMIKTSERVKYGNRNAIVYKTNLKNKKKYVKSKGIYVLVR